MHEPGKLRVKKVWAQLINPRDQLSHQIGYPFFFFLQKRRRRKTGTQFDCVVCVAQKNLILQIGIWQIGDIRGIFEQSVINFSSLNLQSEKFDIWLMWTLFIGSFLFPKQFFSLWNELKICLENIVKVYTGKILCYS